MESKRRSLVKSLSWRMIGIIVLGSVSWMITKNLKTTTSITLLYHLMNTTLYYFHERVWETIEWGLLKRTDLTGKNKEKIMERLRNLGYIE